MDGGDIRKQATYNSFILATLGVDLTREHPVVLVIDDDQNMRWAMRTILTNAGFEVAEAEAGEPGLEIASRCRPYTVLLDMRMPDLGGDEVLRRFRHFDPGPADHHRHCLRQHFRCGQCHTEWRV